MSVLIGSIQIAYKTAAQWTTGNVILKAGQEGHESDTGKRKIGDGTTAWNSLGYIFENEVLGSGTAGSYAMWSSSDTLDNALITEDGNNIIIPSGAYITSDSGTKSQIDLAITGVDGDIRISTDGGEVNTAYLELHRTNQEFTLFDGANFIQSDPTDMQLVHINKIWLQTAVVQLDMPSVGVNKVLTDSDGSGNSVWADPAVVSVNGYTGVIVLDKSDIGLSDVENTALSTWAGSTNLTTFANNAVEYLEAYNGIQHAIVTAMKVNSGN